MKVRSASSSLSASVMVKLCWYALLALALYVSFEAGTLTLDSKTLGILALCLVCELVDGSLGMGYGTTLTPLLLAMGFEPLQLVPTILVSELCSGFAAYAFHHESGNVSVVGDKLHRRVAIVLSACSLVGVGVGVRLAFALPKTALVRVIATIIVVAGVFILLTRDRHASFRTWKLVLLGSVASFNKALSGGGYGPLMTSGQILCGVPGRAAVALTSLAEGFTCLAGAGLFLLMGQRLDPALLVPVLIGALASVPLSAGIVRRVHERILARAIGWMTVLLGVFALVRSF